MDDEQGLDMAGVAGVQEAMGSIQILQTGDVINGDTITLSLEDAAQLIFQQQSLQGDGEGRLQPGTYQIITQPITQGAGNQISIVQAGATDQLQGYEFGGQSIFLQQPNNEDDSNSARIIELPDSLASTNELTNQSRTILSVVKEDSEDSQEVLEVDQQQEDSSLQITGLPVNQAETVFQMINQSVIQPVIKSESHQLGEDDSESDITSQLGIEDNSMEKSALHTTTNSIIIKTEAIADVIENQDHLPILGDEEHKTAMESDLNNLVVINEEQESKELEVLDRDIEDSSKNTVPTQTEEDEGEETEQTITKEVHDGKVLMPTSKPKAIKKPDFSKPIKVTDHMEVIVGGKKCLLKQNPETGQLCAYPIITSTASGKRRGRPKKSEAKESSKPKPAADTEQANSAAEGLLELSNTGPDGIRRSARARKKASALEDYEMLEVSSDDDAAADNAEDEVLPTGAVRKRKISLLKDGISTPPIALQGVKKGRGRPRRYPRPEDTATASQIPAMIIPSGDGQSIMMAPIQGLSNLEAFQEQVRNMTIFQQQKVDTEVEDGTQFLNSPVTIAKPADDESEVSIQPITAQCTNGDLESPLLPKSDMSSISTNDLISTSSIAGLTSSLITSSQDSSLAEAVTPVTGGMEEKGQEGIQPTIIQIPETLLPMFIAKKDPQKIGLKASNTQLEKFKCPKCDFQGYYEQQYQRHIATHTEDVIKCKCCPFVAFEKEDILVHFRHTHPRCICSICDHMAEHAYIIKRHMMRHSQIGCKCNLCGKVYKDQYVLKMHVKMVHLPAEVLFECTVCSKKFTRKAHLKRHLRIHDPEKPFKCPHCPYRGCERSDISKHLLIHEDPKHICEVCGKAFRHVKNKELHMKRHSGQRDYKCGVCDFYGYTFTDIRKHIERKHTDTKAYICDKCGSAFKSELHLREHKAQQCDVFMIEQALAIATTDGGTSQATIQIPSNYSLGNHQIQMDGQNLVIENCGQMTIENVSLPEDGMTLTAEQLHAVVSQSQMSDGSHNQVELIQEMGVDQVQYSDVPDDVGLSEDDVVLKTEIDEDVDAEMNQHMDGIEDDITAGVEDGKSNVNEQILGIVTDYDR